MLIYFETISYCTRIGSSFLHLNFNEPKKWNNVIQFKQYYKYDENVAQRFAKYLLMPEYEFVSIINKNTDKDENVNIKNVAEHFNVSQALAINRGKWLGIFHWEVS